MDRILPGAAVIGCMLLTACAAPQNTPRSDVNIGAPAATDTRPERAIETPAAQEGRKTAARTVGPSSEKLIGMTNEDITAVFGRPVFVRRDPPGEFWRYRAKSCVLELYFYRRDGTWRADHMEMRRGDEAVKDRPACVAALRALPRGS